MPALPLSLMTSLWEQFSAVLPPRPPETHPLGCHRPRIADRLVCEQLLQVLVLGCAYERIADHRCSATTLRTRRNEWIAAGRFATLETVALAAYDRTIGLDLHDVAVDGCIVKAPCGGEAAGRSPVDRGNQGTKRSLLVDGNGIPLGVVVSSANRHDSPLWRPTLALLQRFAPLPADLIVHLDAGYDSAVTRETLAELGYQGEITPKGTRVALQQPRRWVIERTNAWHNRGFGKLAVCTERRIRVIEALIAFANTIIILRRLAAKPPPIAHAMGCH